MVDLSILICTYNRADYLPGAIESCMRQSLDAERYELIVVDNNSSDGTRGVVRQYEHEHTNVRYIVEEQQGLTYARMRGIDEAAGAYVAFVDDDARAHRRWLERLLEAFEQRSPAPVCVGGKVLLDWEGPRPAWYPPDYDGLLAYVDHGDRGFYLRPNAPGHYLIGTNMAFERQALLDIGGFRTHFGRRGSSSLSGDETELINRLLRQGSPVYYEPRAVVTHVVVPERRTRRFLIDRVRGDGQTQPLLDLDRRAFCETNLPRRIGYDAKRALLYLLRSLLLRVRGRRDDAFRAFLGAVQRWGRVDMELRFLVDPEFAPLWRRRWDNLRARSASPREGSGVENGC